MARLIDSVIGHREVWNSLLHLLENGHLPHAMAFVGSAGIGKKKIAWAFAQALVCESETRPCGECPSCKRVVAQQSESVLFIEPTNGVIKLESARQVLQFLNLRRISRARVILIDEAQMLNPQAANSLLKILEEPPEQTYFILIVSELSQMIPTLRSRVQVQRFSPLTNDQIRGSEPTPEWMVNSARGSFAQLEAFRDTANEELRGLTLDYLKGALQGHRSGLDALMDRAKDRDSALGAIHFLQQLLRDWNVAENGDVIHADLPLQELPETASSKKLGLWQEAFKLEQDLNSHVDRSLLFETFFYRAKTP